MNLIVILMIDNEKISEVLINSKVITFLVIINLYSTLTRNSCQVNLTLF